MVVRLRDLRKRSHNDGEIDAVGPLRRDGHHDGRDVHLIPFQLLY